MLKTLLTNVEEKGVGGAADGPEDVYTIEGKRDATEF